MFTAEKLWLTALLAERFGSTRVHQPAKFSRKIGKIPENFSHLS